MTSSTSPHQRRKSFWTPARVMSSFIVLALIAAFGASSCTPPAEVAKTDTNANKPNANVSVTSTTTTTTTSAPANSNPATPSGPTPLAASILNAELKTLDGKVFKLADYAGKVVLINLWATWCGPCRTETPELERMSKEYKSRGVEFIGLTSTGNDPEPERVKAFVREYQVSYTIGYAEDEFVATLMQGRNVIPQSFIITRDGQVYKRFVGFSPTQTPPQLREALEYVLSQ
jgi:thiol-disulfide isomerase/thioredoxin